MNVAAGSKGVKAAPSPKGPSVVSSPAGTELRLKQRYQEKIVPALIQRFAYINAMQVPRLVKVVANIGIGESISNPKALDAATADLKKITGQQPVVLKSRKAIANFKLRAGLPIGIKVTLRGARMYQFVDKLLSVGLPRIRDFRGLSPTGFDGHGNYTLGLREQLVFPEIEYDKIDKLRGLEITFVTTARSDDEARALLGELGFPWRK
ncbi:MAG TPA: 50S ribosomal protein L5 [Candidatus Dormibacteraeota bacterium]|jgi:large subunit ribosomal protein L5|nr:50S ribosomal protein L5 [Candidatus Dormibacteraeota bacterium]